jgi:hypothetical protein
MTTKTTRITVALLIGVLLVNVTLLRPGNAQAAVAGCIAIVAPHQVMTDSTTTFTFSLTASAGDAINSFRIPLLTGYFDVSAASASGWTADLRPDEIFFSGGLIQPGETLNYTLVAKAASSPTPPVYWNVQVGSDGNASDVYCDGDTSVQIQQPQAPIISNIAISELTDTSVIVNWQSDYATTGLVNFGTGTDYGRTTNESGAGGTTHAVKLTGLAANTSYHYRVVSSTGGLETVSDDNTFLTPVRALVPQSGTIVSPSPGVSSGTQVPLKLVPTETEPPTVIISTNLAVIFKSAPVISGTATDNDGVARLEYTTDGGLNWLPVDRAVGIGGKTVTFSFTPVIILDGDYLVAVRAIDLSANVGTSAISKVVIDRLPPQVGETVITFGPEILRADVNGVSSMVAGGDYRLTTHTIGGATSVTLEARRPGSAKTAQSFALAQSSDTGLWSGVLSFSQSGSFDLFAISLDGAGNRTEQRLQSIGVYPPGRVLGKSGAPLTGATVTVYYRDAASKLWSKWDGASYGQTNPQTTNLGTYNLMLPAGHYYLEVGAKGYRTYVSRSFELTRPQSIAADVKMAGGWGMTIGGHYVGLPSWVVQPISFVTTTATSAPAALPATLPNFHLADTSGGLTRAIDLNGRPTVVSLIDSWSPDSTDQVAALAKLQRNGDIRVVPVFTHESLSLAKTFLQTGGYDLTALADPDGVLTAALGAGPGPRHYLIDRSGHIKKLMVGVLSDTVIANELGGL